MRTSYGALLAGLAFVVGGCGDPAGSICETDADCPDGEICRSGECVDPSWIHAPGVDAGGDASSPGGEATLEAPAAVIYEQAGETKTVELRNSGSAPVTIQGIEVDGSPFSVTARAGGGEPDEPTRLEPGESSTIRVQFTPSELTTYEGTLTIESDAEDAPTRVDLLADASGCLDVTPAETLSFEVDSPGAEMTQIVEITNCMEESGDAVAISASFDDDHGGMYSFAETDSLQLRPGETRELPVTFAPGGRTESFETDLRLETDLPGQGAVTLELQGEVSVECPTPRIDPSAVEGDEEIEGGTVAPSTRIELDGTASEASGENISYEWSIVERPVRTGAELSPDTTSPTAEIELDAAGTWKFGLQVHGENEIPSSACEPARTQIRVIPDEEIYIELTWYVPDAEEDERLSGPDLDLHYLHPNASNWYEAPWDIYWDNTEASWPNGGDPNLTTDFGQPPGPETIVHSNPGSNTYRVGVYNFDHPSDVGPAEATLRIFLDGELARSFERTFESRYEFWKAADVEWPSGNVYVRDEMHEDFPPRAH